MELPRTTRQRVSGLFFGLMVLAGAGCGSDGNSGDDAASAVGVRPFSEVQADDFVFEADPTNLERSIFRVTTTEPMICAIVWGETEELGNFNNSLAMNGTGIVDHDVFLPGATPGRTYFFRVQGSTADGALYQSELATFTIPELDTDGPGDGDPAGELGTNLAPAGTIAAVSSEFNDSFAAEHAIDESGLTEWSSAGDGDDASITVDLGASEEIAGVQFITRSMPDGTAIAETFTVTVDDEVTFGPFPTGTAVEPNTAPVAVSGRLVRFDVGRSTGGNVGAIEVRILAP